VNDGIAVRVEQVCKSFGPVRAVRELDLAVAAGRVYGILGPNGAGKTTLIRMLMDIIAPDAGRIEVLGTTALSRVKDRVGYLPEERGLYRKMRAADTLRYFGTIKNVPAGRLRAIVPQRLRQAGLGEWAVRRVDELSRGMQQKLQFLTATIADPDLLILDEPFSGLDPVNLEVLMQQIVAMRDQGRTILLSTHVMEQAERLCDSVMLIHKGRKILDGRLAEVLSRTDPRTIVLETRDDPPQLARLPFVESVEKKNRHHEIRLNPRADPQELLSALVGHCQILRFEVKHPTLHEVFLASVGEKPEAATQTISSGDRA
jgi:ABC-2 type transport system ATP-binding protein